MQPRPVSCRALFFTINPQRTVPSQSKRSKIMAFELPPLPFDKSALEPHMSAKTLEFHHGKHHRAYVETLNKLIEGTGLEKESLENIIMATAGDDRTTQKKTFNN